MLHFIDQHSNDEDIVYTLSSQPYYGDLLISDTRGGMKILNQTNKIRQGDISNGRLSYSSFKEVGLEPVIESILFNVTDPNNNALTNQV